MNKSFVSAAIGALIASIQFGTVAAASTGDQAKIVAGLETLDSYVLAENFDAISDLLGTSPALAALVDTHLQDGALVADNRSLRASLRDFGAKREEKHKDRNKDRGDKDHGGKDRGDKHDDHKGDRDDDHDHQYCKICIGRKTADAIHGLPE